MSTSPAPLHHGERAARTRIPSRPPARRSILRAIAQLAQVEGCYTCVAGHEISGLVGNRGRLGWKLGGLANAGATCRGRRGRAGERRWG
jgi:hypothetical protein